MKTFILFFLLSVPCLAFSQVQADVSQVDTLKAPYKTDGSIDSIDFPSQVLRSTFPSSSLLENNRFIAPFLITQIGGAQLNSHNFFQETPKFSAIPHIGAAYSFGSQTAQYLRFDYDQVFKGNLCVNFQIKQLSTAGFIRNSAWKNTSISTAILRNSKRYSFLLNAKYFNESRGFCKGVIFDSLANSYPLPLIPVQSESANGSFTQRSINLSHRLDFSYLDTTLFAGLIVQNAFATMDKYFREKGSLSALYNLIQFDSLETNDHYAQIDLQNNAGFGIKNSLFTVEALITSRYWKYSIHNLQRDTTEFGLKVFGKYGNKSKFVSNSFQYNLIGGFKAWDNLSVLRWIKGKHDLGISSLLQNSAPLLNQRFCSTNNYLFQLSDFNLQRRLDLRLSYKLALGSQQIAVHYIFQKATNLLVFNGATWLNSSALSAVQLQQISLKSNVNLGHFKINPSYTYTAMDANYRFYPAHLFQTRCLVKGGVFKAKKLKMIGAIDLMASSKFKAPTLNAALGILDFSQLPSATWQAPLINGGLMLGLEIETFRFFINMDNLAYFWSDKSSVLVQSYTLPTWQLKVGLIWDFWD
jgi:hypothetical protein